jgi:hypothetical protein
LIIDHSRSLVNSAGSALQERKSVAVIGLLSIVTDSIQGGRRLCANPSGSPMDAELRL